MDIALAGIGQMGRAVEAVASAAGHDIVARFSSDNPAAEASQVDLNGAEVVIDFSLPHLALHHIRRYTALGVAAVMGTTGWYDRLDEARRLVADGHTGLLYAPNFSLGVALLTRAIRGILPLVDHLTEFDVFVHEIHHTKKVDSPSGTGLMLGHTLVNGLDRKHRIEPQAIQGRIDPSALHVSSTRAGSVFGRHTIGLDSPFDELSFEHRAKSREGFASGAVRAAEWLQGRHGFYSLDDVLDSWMHPS